MPRHMRKLRFPNGESEYRIFVVELEVGVLIWGRKGLWVVSSIAELLVFLERLVCGFR